MPARPVNAKGKRATKSDAPNPLKATAIIQKMPTGFDQNQLFSQNRLTQSSRHTIWRATSA
jgi:hypothetical protein